MIITTDEGDNGYGALIEQYISTKELFNNRKRIVSSCNECRTISFICIWKKIYNLHRSPTKYTFMEQITTTSTSRKMDDENGVVSI
jgi:hypothetical protein